MEIEIEGRRTVIQPEWNRPHLEEKLKKSALALAKIDVDVDQRITNNVSAIHSLATCLLQHSLNRYNSFQNLSKAWPSDLGDHCSEDEWMRFRLKLEKESRQVTDKVSPSSDNTTDGVDVESDQTDINRRRRHLIESLPQVLNNVTKVFDEFSWFRLDVTDINSGVVTIICLADGKQTQVRPRNANRMTPLAATGNAKRYYVWFDSDANTFHCIVKWGDTFQDRNAFRIALTFQLSKDLREFYGHLLNKDDPSDEELEARALRYLRDLNEQSDHSTGNYLKLLERWDAECPDDNAGSSGLKVLLKELLLLDDGYNNVQADAINFNVRLEFMECLELVYGQLQLQRLEDCEKTRLTIVESRDAEERKERRFNLEIEAVTADIKRLEQEQADDESATLEKDEQEKTLTMTKTDSRNKAAIHLDDASNGLIPIIKQLKEEEEQLAWDRFRELLSELQPPYELLNNKRQLMFITDQEDASAMIEGVCRQLKLEESFQQQTDGNNMLHLTSYVRRHRSAALDEVRRLVDKMVEQPVRSRTGATWNFDGCGVILRKIHLQWSRENRLSLTRQLQLQQQQQSDASFDNSPLLCEEIVITASRVIYVDCDWRTPGVSLVLTAPRIVTLGPGTRRVIDTSGADAGHVSIYCDVLEGCPLTIHAKGGDGGVAAGQDGGHGGEIQVYCTVGRHVVDPEENNCGADGDGEGYDKPGRGVHRDKVKNGRISDEAQHWNLQALQATSRRLLRSQRKATAFRRLGRISTEHKNAITRAIASSEELKRNESETKMVKESERRVKEAFDSAKATLIKTSATQSVIIRTTSNTVRMTDYQPTGSDIETEEANNNESERYVSSSDRFIVEMQRATDSVWQALDGVDLLDALFAKYYLHSDEESRTVSFLAQSLVLQIYLPDEANPRTLWRLINDIVLQSASKADTLIQSLTSIVQDIDLVQQIRISNQARLLVEMSDTMNRRLNKQQKESSTSKTKLSNRNDVSGLSVNDILNLLYRFRQMSWTYEELQSMLKPLEAHLLEAERGVDQETKTVSKRLVEHVGERLLRSVCDCVMPLQSSDDVVGVGKSQRSRNSQQWLTKLLKDLFQFCSARSITAPLAMSTFFDKLVAKSKWNNVFDLKKKKTVDDVDAALTDFAYLQQGIRTIRHLLGSSQNSSRLTDSSESTTSEHLEDLDKLNFMLEHFKIDVDELDAVRSELEERRVVHKEPYKSVYNLAGQAFAIHYWNAEWSAIWDRLAQLDSETKEVSDLQKAVGFLKKNLEWKHCRQSFQQKWNVCKQLRKKLCCEVDEHQDRSQLLMTLIDWVQQQEMQMNGFLGGTSSQLSQKSRASLITGNRRNNQSKATFMLLVEWSLSDIRPNRDDVNILKPLRRALFYLDQGDQLTFNAPEVELLATLLSEEATRNLFDDDLSVRRDVEDLRTKFFEQWSERYFKHWTDCYAEADAVRREVQQSWNGRINNNLLLDHYNLLTGFFLSPCRLLEEWQSLLFDADHQEHLDEVIKCKVRQNFGHLFQQMIVDAEATVEKLFDNDEEHNKVMSFPDTFNSSDQLKRCLTIVDTLVRYFSTASTHFNEDLAWTVSSLLSDVEMLFIGYVQLEDCCDTESNKSWISTQLKEWMSVIKRAKLEQLHAGDGQRREDSNAWTSAAVSETLTDTLEIISRWIASDGSFSVTEAHRQFVKKAVQLQRIFIDHLNELLDNRHLDIVKATVRRLGNSNVFSPWSLGRPDDRRLMPSLVAKQIAIWNDCTPDYPEFHPRTNDASAFLDALLSSESTAMLKLRITIANQLLIHHLDTPKDVAVLEHWSKLNDSVTTAVSSSSSIEFDDQDLSNRLAKLQASLIRHFDVFQSRQLLRHNKTGNETNNQFKSTEMIDQINHKMIVDRLIVLSKVFGNSEAERNRFVIAGLAKLARAVEEMSFRQTDSEGVMASSSFISQLLLDDNHDIKGYYNDEEDEINRKKVAITVFLSSESNRPSFSLHEKALLERCLQSEALFRKANKLLTDKFISQLENAVESASPSNYSTNRFASIISFGDVFNNEESRYVAIAGREAAQEVFETHPPDVYLPALRDRAVERIRQKLVEHFYPSTQADGNLIPMTEFRQSFDRAYVFALRNNVEFKWLLWLQEVVIKSLESMRKDLVTPSAILQLLSYASADEIGLDQVFQSTTTCRPYRWMGNLLIDSILRAIAKLHLIGYDSNKADEGGGKLLESNLHQCLRLPRQRGHALLEMFRDKLEQEYRLFASDGALEFADIVDVVDGFKTLKTLEDVDRFRHTSLRQWPQLLRRDKLRETWPAGLVDQVCAYLDCRLGGVVTDRFLDRYQRWFEERCKLMSIQLYADVPNLAVNNRRDSILEGMLKNLCKYPWIVDYFFRLSREHVDGDSREKDGDDDDDSLWQRIQNPELIESERSKAGSLTNLSVDELLCSMKNDPGSKEIIGGNDEVFAQQIAEIKSLAESEPRKCWTTNDIAKWAKSVKKTKGKMVVDPVDYLSVALRAVKLHANVQVRDAQLLAILVFLSPNSKRKHKAVRRMAQISTGEGKTLITALLVVYHVLSNWKNGCHLVDVVTSSPVLAVANVEEMKWFYEMFGVGVENNCDAACAGDDKVRRKRYASDVVYGDLSSFQHDILLTRFLANPVITCKREAGAVVVDEVDSMLLDKGENILYLSHNMPEMDELIQLFVDIWYAVHDPSVAKGADNEQLQSAVRKRIKERIDDGDIHVPKCLKEFVSRHLTLWIRNAFRAKTVASNDAYKVEDIGDGRGQQIVIMDKETGVEQVQMQWSHGLHQFLQLKHALKLSPLSLKAVFMSNVGFFNERKETPLYGMTGTLGSAAECQLLHEVFKVDFFKMPRFRRRFCTQEDHLLSTTENQWLENLVQATKKQVDANKRAVLVVCENIATAELAHNKLTSELNSGNNDDATINRYNISKYISSFDKDFQKKQQDSALVPGDVIVATNLAGRGTDFKISQDLSNNGGLHVIIGYMPANARVEAQIEGRVARAGQKGSYQFVLWDAGVRSSGESRVESELSRLKLKRDYRECCRLEHIRTRGMQKILREEEYFRRFHCEIFHKAKKKLSHSADGELKLKFLTNRWALWLDENGENIDHVSKDNSEALERNFEVFQKHWNVVSPSCRESCFAPDHGAFCFASTPSEFLTLGDFYEDKGQPEKARRCYLRVKDDEPEACQVALIRLAKLELHKADGVAKSEAKKLLVRAKKFIKKYIAQLSVASSKIELTAVHYVIDTSDHSNNDSMTITSSGSSSSKAFKEQITNLVSLLNVHSTAIDDILGWPLDTLMNVRFPKASEAQELLALVTDAAKCPGLCAPYRLSKRVCVKSYDDDDCALCLDEPESNNDEQRTISWPLELDYCRREVIQLVKKDGRDLRTNFPRAPLAKLVATRNQVWDELVGEGYIGQVKVVVTDVIHHQRMTNGDPKRITRKLSKNLQGLLDSSILVGWLDEHGGCEWEQAVTPLKRILTSGQQLAAFKQWLVDENLLVRVVEKTGVFLKNVELGANDKCGSVSIVGLPASLRRYDLTLAAWIVKRCSDDSLVIGSLAGSSVSLDDLPFAKDALEGAGQVHAFLVDQGVIKQPKVAIAFGLDAANKRQIDGWKSKVKRAIYSMEAEMKEICWKHRPPSIVVDDNDGSVLTTVKDTLSYCSQPLFNRGSAKRAMNASDWRMKRRDDRHLAKYQDDVVSALLDSVGHLRTEVRVQAVYQLLSDYVPTNNSGPETYFYYPADEMRSLVARSYDKAIKLTHYKIWWDYWSGRSVCVLMLGVVQIVAGLTIALASSGVVAELGLELVSLGVKDFEFVLDALNRRTEFSWKEYGEHKIRNLLKQAVFKIIAKLTINDDNKETSASSSSVSSFLLAAESTLNAHRKAVQSALDHQVNSIKANDWLKRHLVDSALSSIDAHVTTHRLTDALSEPLDRLWTIMSQQSGLLSVEDYKCVVEGCLGAAKSSELFALWSRRLDALSSEAGASVGRRFSEMKGVGNLLDAVGIDSWADASNSDENGHFFSCAREHVENVKRIVCSEIRKLEAEEHGNRIRSTASAAQQEDLAIRELIEQYKRHVMEAIESDIMACVTESVTQSWQQPNIQSRIESVVASADTEASESIDLLLPEPNKIRIAPTAMTTTIRKLNGASRLTNEQSNNDERNKVNLANDEEAVAVEIMFEKLLGEGNARRVVSADGSLVLFIQPKTYVQVVQSLIDNKNNNQLKAGRLQVQLIADATNRCPLSRIVDETMLMLDLATPVDRILYGACSGKCPADNDLLNSVRTHALYNRTGLYIYNRGVAEVCREVASGRTHRKGKVEAVVDAAIMAALINPLKLLNSDANTAQTQHNTGDAVRFVGPINFELEKPSAGSFHADVDVVLNEDCNGDVDLLRPMLFRYVLRFKVIEDRRHEEINKSKRFRNKQVVAGLLGKFS